MDLQLQGKRALITGASKGIGLAIARQLAEEGCKLVLVGRDPAALKQAEGVCGSGVAEILPADLSTEAGIATVVEMSGELDILVNNAGAIPPGDLAALSPDDWRRAWDLKVFGYIGLTRGLWPKLKTRQGVVINIIGAAGERPDPAYLAGTCGNAALMAFTRAQGRAAPREGMRMVGINPGPVATERMETFLRARATRDFGDAERWREALGDLAFGRPAYPGEIADAVAFLASPRASYISGTILTIDDPAREI